MKWCFMIYYCLSKNIYKMKLLNFDKQHYKEKSFNDQPNRFFLGTKTKAWGS